MAHGHGTVPKLSLKPKNIAVIIAKIAAAKTPWQTKPKDKANKIRGMPAGGENAAFINLSRRATLSSFITIPSPANLVQWQFR